MSTTNLRNRSTQVTPPVPNEELEAMLEEAPRWEMNLREALAWLCATEVARTAAHARVAAVVGE